MLHIVIALTVSAYLRFSWILFLSETLSLAGLEVMVEAVLHADRRISRELLLFEN